MIRRVPFYPLNKILETSAHELAAAFNRVLSDGLFVLGPDLVSFENSFASFVGSEHCVGVASGHDALLLSLKAAGIGEGDEVIVSSHTFASSWLAIIQAGATPVPIDSDPITRNLDIELIIPAITSRTKAILVVHIYGRPCDMGRIGEIAAHYGIPVIEDCAQAHGAKFQGNPTGNFGDLSAFSFYPTKTLGCLGDGGAICCNSEGYLNLLRSYRNYGSPQKYIHDLEGTNSRLDNLQAAFLSVRLARLEKELEQRSLVAAAYFAGLSNMDIKLPPKDCELFKSSWHLFVIEIKDRDAVKMRLSEAGVETEIHYPTPLHRQRFSRTSQSEQRTALPVTEKICETCLSLPIWPGMKEHDTHYVIEQLKKIWRR